MSDFTPSDCEFMALALRLARRGVYTCHPNPRVGCVLVRDGQVVGQGWHVKAGEEHAEINALADAGDAAQNAVAYVTLEPCSHHGKTPPCSSALIDAGISKMIVAGEDPNPKVGGAGIAELSDAGVDVRIGLMASEAAKLNEGFLSRVERKRPFVRLKVAASLDGATAMASGESQWITGAAARADVQRMRASSGAIMTGIGTVLADDPSLTVRDEAIDAGGLQPVRVVLDSQLKTPPKARMLSAPGSSRIYCIDDKNRAVLETANADVRVVSARKGRPDIAAVLADLAQCEINDVLVEAGATLSGALLASGLVDELVIFQAPHIMGSNTHGMFTTPEWLQLNDRASLEIIGMNKVGDDIKIVARPRS